MPVRTREINRQMLREAERALRQKMEAIANHAIPEALRQIGEEAVAHSITTHEYNNRSGELEKSHFSQVILPGKSADVEFIGKGGVSVQAPVRSAENEVTLVVGARQYYGFYVEVFHGFSVVLNTFLKLRRELQTQLGVRLRSIKLF